MDDSDDLISLAISLTGGLVVLMFELGIALVVGLLWAAFAIFEIFFED